MKYILSILIPTRNRCYYATQTVNQILSLNMPDVQIVVADNGDTDELRNLWQDISCIKYIYTANQISFVNNFSLATEAAEGEYLIAIGDDDGIRSDILPITRFAYEHDLDAVTPNLNLIYAWPDSNIVRNHTDGVLGVSKVSAKAYMIDTKEEVVKLLENGCLDYLKFHLAKVYHGIVKKSLMDKVKNIVGVYFNGLTPDIYSAVALSVLADKTMYIDFPVTISGMCPKSGSADSANGRHTGDIKKAPHFNGHNGYEWNKLVPKVYSVETIWADSALSALKDLNEADMAEHFKILPLAARLYSNYPQFNRETNECVQQYCTQKKVGAAFLKTLLIFHEKTKKLIHLMRRIIRRIFRTKRKFVQYKNLNTILEANEAGNMHINQYFATANIVEKMQKCINDGLL